MADKSFGVKQVNLINASGTPRIDSPNNLNINAVNVAISTDITVGGKLSLGTGTSISSPTTNVLAFGTNNVEVSRFDSSGRLGIGTAYTPNARVDVSLDGFVANTTSQVRSSSWGANGIINLYNSKASTTGSEILLLGSCAAGLGELASGIGFGRESDGNWGTYLSFKTHSTSTATIDELYERARIDSSGRVGINTIPTSANSKLFVASSPLSTAASSTDGGILLTPTQNLTTNQYAPAISWTANAGAPNRARAAIAAQSTNATSGMDLVFLTRNQADGTELTFNTDEKARITSSGSLLIGTQTVAGSAALQIVKSSGDALLVRNGDTNYEGFLIQNSSGFTDILATSGGSTSRPGMRFFTNDTARMQIALNGQRSSVLASGSTLFLAYDCRAWVNFSGTGSTGANQSIRGSGNVSSVFKNGGGNYTMNFTNAMADANYCIAWTVGSETNHFATVSSSSAAVLRTGGADPTECFAAIFR